MRKIIERVGMIVVMIGLGVGTAGAADVEATRKHIKEAIASGEAMVSHGKQGHLDVLSKHAKDFITHAKAALDGIPADNEHGKEVSSHLKTAISEAEEAIKHGAEGHKDVAVKHAENALSHAKEAQSHAEGL